MGALTDRATAGECIEVACRCGWDNDGALTLIDVYTQESPPGPRGRGDWLALDIDDSDYGARAAVDCADCALELVANDETTYAERAPDLLAALKDSLDRAADAKGGT